MRQPRLPRRPILDGCCCSGGSSNGGGSSIVSIVCTTRARGAVPTSSCQRRQITGVPSRATSVLVSATVDASPWSAQRLKPGCSIAIQAGAFEASCLSSAWNGCVRGTIRLQGTACQRPHFSSEGLEITCWQAGYCVFSGGKLWTPPWKWTVQGRKGESGVTSLGNTLSQTKKGFIQWSAWTCCWLCKIFFETALEVGSCSNRICKKVYGRLWCRARSGSTGFRRRFRRRLRRRFREAAGGSAEVCLLLARSGALPRVSLYWKHGSTNAQLWCRARSGSTGFRRRFRRKGSISPHAWESLTPAVWQFSSACISPAIGSRVSTCCNIHARRIRERLKLTVVPSRSCGSTIHVSWATSCGVAVRNCAGRPGSTELIASIWQRKFPAPIPGVSTPPWRYPGRRLRGFF